MKRLRPGFAVIGVAIPVSDFAKIVMAILSDVNPEETSALSLGGQDVWCYILWRDNQLIDKITKKINDSLSIALFFIL